MLKKLQKADDAVPLNLWSFLPLEIFMALRLSKVPCPPGICTRGCMYEPGIDTTELTVLSVARAFVGTPPVSFFRVVRQAICSDVSQCGDGSRPEVLQNVSPRQINRFQGAFDDFYWLMVFESTCNMIARVFTPRSISDFFVCVMAGCRLYWSTRLLGICI